MLNLRRFHIRTLSTVTRLMLIYAVISAAALGLVLTQVIRTYASHAKSVIISDLGEEVPGFANAANLRPANEDIYSFARSYLSSHVVSNQHILFIDIFGHTVLGSIGSSGVISLDRVSGFLANPPRTTTFVTSTLKSTPYLVMVSPIIENGNVLGSLVGVTSLSELQRQEGQVMLLAGTEALVALIFSIAAGYFLLRRVMHAVGKVTETAVEISRGDLDRRIDLRGQSDEVGRLALAFDEMISRISNTMDSQRRLLADVSHQLKTPLTVIRGNLELVSRSKDLDKAELDEVIGVVISETDYMKAMLEGLLMLERMSEGGSLDEQVVDLRSFISDVFTSALTLGKRDWHLGDVPDLLVSIDGPKVRGALLNLLDNAEKATTEGEFVSLFVVSHNGYLDMSVADSGSGIGSEYLDRIFERFERGTSRDQRGAGLGLAIVQAVAKAHGGTVKVDTVIGSGSTFTMRFPSSRVVTRE
ncbi:MAG: HAMP domain-containing sensor histidine kinase [Actinomycetota bacterium]|nr:HAMP domain-containing sensor histidine kinase [Actinomycetota bacterium]